LAETNLKIEGMSCMHCVGRVKNALKSVEGVESAKVNLEDKQAFVKYDSSKTTMENFKVAVEEVGYKVVSRGD
jgi:copper ion binding protein